MNPDRKPISRLLFFWSYLAASLIGSGLMVHNWTSPDIRPEAVHSENPALFLLGCLLNAYAGIILVVLIYRLWQSVPPGFARTSPRRAVGFLFIPLFNLYWLIQAVWGWTRDFNRGAGSRGRDKPMSEALGLLTAILGLLSGFAVIGLSIAFGTPTRIGVYLSYLFVITMSVFIHKALRCVNSDKDNLHMGPKGRHADSRESQPMTSAQNDRNGVKR